MIDTGKFQKIEITGKEIISLFQNAIDIPLDNHMQIPVFKVSRAYVPDYTKETYTIRLYKGTERILSIGRITKFLDVTSFLGESYLLKFDGMDISRYCSPSEQKTIWQMLENIYNTDVDIVIKRICQSTADTIKIQCKVDTGDTMRAFSK